MIKTSAEQCHREEKWNTLSHGLGFLLSVVGAIVMSYYSIKNGNTLHMIAGAVFSLTMIILYASSTFYHRETHEQKKEFYRFLDQSAIYLFIAGSYTLVLLTLLEGTTTKIILTLQWTIAIVGIIVKYKLKSLSSLKSLIVDSIVYLLMGWMIVFFYDHMKLMPELAYNLTVAGGICYSIGVLFFLSDHKIRYFHTLWHIFVLAGSTFHYLIGIIYI